MTNHGFIDPEAPLRRRIDALERQVQALAEQPDESGEGLGYFTFSPDELAKHDAEVLRAAAHDWDNPGGAVSRSMRVTQHVADWLRERADRIAGDQP